MKKIRRSLLFMPGNSLKKIQKATTLSSDSIIMDLEDGLALNQKKEGRKTIIEAFQDIDFGEKERLIRINPLSTSLALEDLDAIVALGPDGLVIPKVESFQELKKLCKYLQNIEKQKHWPLFGIHIFALIETARGVISLPQIIDATPRLTAIMFGSEDLAGDVGAMRTSQGLEVFYARSAVVIAAAACGVDAIDTIYPDLNDLSGLAEECRFAKQLGYQGKMAIHPNQLQIINHEFLPTKDEIRYAEQLLEVYKKQQENGHGVFEFQGKMVDMPMIRRAEYTLSRCKTDDS